MKSVQRYVFIGFGCVVATGIALFWLFRAPNPENPPDDTRSTVAQSIPVVPRETPPELLSASVARYPASIEPRREHPVPVVVPAQPTTNPVSREVAAESGTYASNCVPGEWILRFRDRATLQEFLGRDGPQRSRIADVAMSLNAVRLVGMSAEQVVRLEREMPGAFEYSPNLRVELPRVPGRWSIAPDPAQPYAGFGPGTLSWLGITGDHKKWGEGVSVAILDTGVGRCQSLRDESVIRIDLTGEGPGETGGASAHATVVANILAGGVTGKEGVSPSSQIISIKVLSGNGSGESFTLAKGIEEAISRGARIVNLCLGSRGDCPLVRQAVDRALSYGIIIVAAVGNDSTEGVSYPARYEGVLGVTAVDAAGRRLDFANSGPEVDLAAPGLDVWAAVSADSAMRMSGTSAAVPFVSGALAYLLSKEPGLKASEAIDLLLRNSNDAGMPGRDQEYGCGILNVRRVIDRDVKGICDAAIVDNCIDAASAGDGQLSLVVSVQNRGTELLSGVDLRVMISEFRNAVRLADIGVGETVGCRFVVRLPDGNATNVVRVVSDVSIRGARDDNPLNNSRETVFTITGQNAQR